MFLEKISATRSDIIDQCLYKYDCKYNKKLPGFGNKNEESLNFGSFIHKVFELGYNLNCKKELVKLAESKKKDYKISFSLQDKTKKCIDNFLVFNSGLGETISTEMTFEVDLDASHNIKFIGVIDRIVKGSSGGYLVIDYKTSKREKKKKDLLTDKQLMGYAYAIHTLYNVPYKDIFCCHYYPLTNTLVDVRFSEFQISMWKKKEIEKVWRIRKKKATEFPAMKNIFCDHCEYKPMCPKFNSPEEVCVRLEEQLVLKRQLEDAKKILEDQQKDASTKE